MPRPRLPVRPSTVPPAPRAADALRRFRAVLAALALALPGLAVAASAPVTRLEVRIVTGADPAAPGGVVELRLRETGRADRRLTLTRGDAWPANSTRVIPLTLAEPLDPDAVTRFGIWYRAAGGPVDAWEVASAEVYAGEGRERVRLLDTAVQGLLRREGEIATSDRAAASSSCLRDSECDDGRTCNGRERCAPGARGTDARGCLPGTPLMCPTNQVCVEGQGCRGVDGVPGADDAAAAGGAPALPANGTPAAPVPAAPAPRVPRGVVALQSCSGADVLLTDADGTQRRAACPAGTACVPQPNGSGVCAPAAR